MRKKMLSNTYLRGVSKYNLKILKKEDYYICIKHVLEIDKAFILSTGLCLLDNGYYIIEILPVNENYCIRIFIDKDKNILQHYIDISLENGVDDDSNIPYYDDLYTDITITDGVVEVLDEDELKLALDENIISKDNYLLANKTKDDLLNQINNNSNKYLNLEIKEFLKYV